MDESDPRMPATHPTTPSVPDAPIARPVAPTLTTPLCPYCGVRVDDGPDAARCTSCKGLLDPLSRQATQNAMGPWTLRDEANPFSPGCSFDTVRTLVARGRIRRDTILRGPTTRQFWMFAANTPGVAVLLGECHACHHAARTDEFLCAHCGAVLSPQTERQSLGLAPVRLLPGAATSPAIAASVLRPAPHAPPIADAPPPTIPTPAPLRRGIDRSALTQTPPPDIASPSAALAHRRRRDRVQTITIGLTIAVIAVGTLLVLLVVMAVHNADRDASTPAPETTTPASTTAPPEPTPSAPIDTAAEPTQAPTPAAPPPPPPPTPAPPPTVAGLSIDPGLDAWHDAIAQAAALESTDTLEDLDRAIEILERVRTEAASTTTDAFPILTARIAALRERSASLHARNG
jgi:hypothetical protein